MAINFVPKVVGWELTKKCNMRCIHCGSSAGESRDNELTVEEGLRLCDEIADLGCQALTLSGGEPLMHPAFDVYAKKLVDRGVKVYMITNGLLVEEKMDRIAAAGIKRLGLSYDGTKEHHNYIRQNPKSFDSVIKAVKLLRERGIKAGAISHISKVNFHDLEEMYQNIVAHGFAFWQIQTAFLNGRMKENESLACPPEDMIPVAQFIEAKRKENKIPMIIGDNFGYYSQYNITDTEWRGCFGGRWLMGIDSDGGIKGCLSLPKEFVEGNIRERSLRDIWEDRESFKYNRYFCADDLGENCKGCEKGMKCRGGCVITSYSATGKVHNNPYCLYKVEQKARMGETI